MRQIGITSHPACPASLRQEPSAADGPMAVDGLASMFATSVVSLARRAAELTEPPPCSENPPLWFSERPADLELAKEFCRQCPLRVQCLAGAVERAEPVGVWGGEIFDRGVITAYKRPRGRPPGAARSRESRGAA